MSQENTVFVGPQGRATKAILDYWDEAVEEISPGDVIPVWFCYILGGWKTLMIIKSYPDHYFEITYNAIMKEMYLDHYEKAHNRVIKDDSDTAISMLREKLSKEY